jgi:diadenosine tetraphosphate (Ap4A) HIT family hydrolase
MTIEERVAAARRGENPAVIARVPSGWLVAGDSQMVRGYCVLLADPVVENLNSLVGEVRTQFLHDMAWIGDCLLEVTEAARINYEMLGNLDRALHCHLFPRYDDEDEAMRTKPIWFYDWEAARPLDSTDDRWRARLKSRIEAQQGGPEA